jgi:hypothetical protein
MSDQPPPSDPAAGSDPPPSPSPSPPPPPPYGQAGASWPNSQPLPPPPPAYDPAAPGMPPTVAGPPYGGGQPPQGPPGSRPYGGPGGYGGPYIPPIPKQTSAGKIVAIVVGVILLLVCGGCFAFGAVIYSTGRDIAREIESYDPPDDIDTVVSVAPGETFLVGDYSISPGWSVATQGPVLALEGMTATKIGAPRLDTVAFDMTFFRGDKVLGQATCSGSVPEDATEGEVVCMITDRKVRKADRVEIQSLI